MPEIALIRENFTAEDQRNFERFVAVLVELAMKNGLKARAQKRVSLPEPPILPPPSEEPAVQEKVLITV